MADVKITDNSDEVMEAMTEAIQAALEAIGQQAVSHAKQNITEAGRVDTGAMRNSVTHQVEMGETAVYIGTNQEYAVYHELGTGIYTEGGGGRQTPWSYQDARGEWHRTRGIRPTHFLKNAVANHGDEFMAIAEQQMKGE